VRTLTKKDHVSIVFGEWFDKSAGNTYYDALVRVNDESFQVPYQYGYNASSAQSIDDALEHAGFKVREDKHDRYAGYYEIHASITTKLKRELFK